MQQNQLLTAKEMADYIRVHFKTVYKWKAEGRIPYVETNGLIRFNKNDIEEWIKKRSSITEQFVPLLPKVDSLEAYDRMLLKGDSAVSKKKQRWNYGFGSVYVRKTKHGKERWYLDYRDEERKRIQKLIPNAQTKEDTLIALQAEVSKCYAREHGVKNRPQRIKFAQFADMFLQDYSKVNKCSWKDDRDRLKQFKVFIGAVYLDEISPIDIQRFKRFKLKEGVTKTTVNHYLKTLKRLFNIAIDWGYAETNPVTKIKMYPENNTKRERILTQEEEKHLFEAAATHLKSIIILALNTGMRRGEILSLKWRNIDLQKGEILIEKAKSGKSRVVDVNSVLFKELLNLRSANPNQEHVFLNPKTGKPFTKLQTSFEGACRRAGIEGLRFHDLRHSVASRLIAAGVDIIKVKELLGHSTVKMTERYLHTDRSGRKQAVEQLCSKTPKPVQNQDDLLHICDTEGKRIRPILATSLFSVN